VVARLKQIEDRGKPLNEAVGLIAMAAHDQRANIETVTRSLSELNQATQGIAASAEESAAAASELNAQSEGLLDSIEQLSAMVGAESNRRGRF
jgi:methyl-accepting chemotaxis protein